MKKRPSLILVFLFTFFITAAAQQQTPRPPEPANPQRKNEDEVVRITTNLVQVDAVVAGKDGKLVTDLKPEEFEIYEDGRQQKIVNFSFVSTESKTPSADALKSSAPADKTAAPVPPVRLRPEQVRRTIALVVDDLGLSFESTYYVRRALKKFVDEQLQPGDLVAIIRTAGGVGALQQFTSDKRQLYAAIERVRWNPIGRSGTGAFAPIEGDSLAQSGEQLDRDANDTSSASGGEDVEEFRETMFSVGTLGAIGYVVRGMRELPGRKSILLMSDGIRIFYSEDATKSA